MPYTATIAISDEVAAALDRWRATQPGLPSRRAAMPMAIEAMVMPKADPAAAPEPRRSTPASPAPSPKRAWNDRGDAPGSQLKGGKK
jgi:hypothetical protein